MNHIGDNDGKLNACIIIRQTQHVADISDDVTERITHRIRDELLTEKSFEL